MGARLCLLRHVYSPLPLRACCTAPPSVAEHRTPPSVGGSTRPYYWCGCARFVTLPLRAFCRGRQCDRTPRGNALGTADGNAHSSAHGTAAGNPRAGAERVRARMQQHAPGSD